MKNTSEIGHTAFIVKNSHLGVLITFRWQFFCAYIRFVEKIYVKILD